MKGQKPPHPPADSYDDYDGYLEELQENAKEQRRRLLASQAGVGKRTHERYSKWGQKLETFSSGFALDIPAQATRNVVLDFPGLFRPEIFHVRKFPKRHSDLVIGKIMIGALVVSRGSIPISFFDRKGRGRRVEWPTLERVNKLTIEVRSLQAMGGSDECFEGCVMGTLLREDGD